MLGHFPDAWDRSIWLADGVGEVRREMSVRKMVEMLTDHMLEHAQQIEEILHRVRGLHKRLGREIGHSG